MRRFPPSSKPNFSARFPRHQHFQVPTSALQAKTDTIDAKLRPYESVMVPEFTQMVGGPKGVNALNRAAEHRFPKHFAFGGVAPTLQGGPAYDPRMEQRGMPPVFDGRAPAMVAPPPQVPPSPFPAEIGGGAEPMPLGGIPGVLRQPMQMPPHVDPRLAQGGVRQPMPFDPHVDPRIQHFRQGGVATEDGLNPGAFGGTPSSFTSPTGQGPTNGGGWAPPGELNQEAWEGPSWAENGFDPGESRFSNWGYIGAPGTPGFLQGRTMLPTFFDNQGYPFGLAVGEAATGNRNESIHVPPRHNQ